jgi:carboxypeptidase C (cathepsin A)
MSSLSEMLSRSTFVALAAGYASAAVPADLVTDLPGFGAPLSKLYSGYLNAGKGKYLHYVYSESLRTPSTDPVVIWFNGWVALEALKKKNSLFCFS